MNFLNPTLRAPRSIAFGGTLLLLALLSGGCSKTELADATTGTPGEERAAGGYFLMITQNGVPRANYVVDLHCGPDLVTNADGIIPWGPACPLLNQMSVGNLCLQRNKDYFLKPTVGVASPQNLRFKFSIAFPSTPGPIQLMEYDIVTDVWTVNGTIVATGLAILAPQAASVRLPRCVNGSSTIPL